MVDSVASQRTVRLLMALWDGALTKGKLIEKVKKSGKVVEDYPSIVEPLIDDRVVTQSGEKLRKLDMLQASKDLSNALIYNLLDSATIHCNPIF
jgi:hypothetical protein